MKYKINNFRSIKDQEIEIAPITLLYGPNSAGKSSLMYSLLTAKNIVLNPNQNLTGFFNYNFVNLGGFEAIVFDHQKDKNIELALTEKIDNSKIQYRILFGGSQNIFSLSFDGDLKGKLELPVSFPYPMNQQTTLDIKIDEVTFNISWNGITSKVQIDSQDQKAKEKAERLAIFLNAPAEQLRKLSVVPLRRGFSKPSYSSVSITPWLITEDEIASYLSSNKYLVSRISYYLEQILDQDFRVNVQPGTAIFSLDTTNKKTGVSSELVNEGFGVNQLVYILAKSLSTDINWVWIEDPEIHLHPTAIRRFVSALVNIYREEGKQFVLTTHSESLVSAFLAVIVNGNLKPSELACYLVQKEKKITQFNRQIVNEKGQIEGGLNSFIEGELEDIRTFLKTSK